MTSARQREHDRKWREANRDKARLAVARWSAAHPERVRAKNQRQRARRRCVPTEDFLDIEIFERDGWICQLCLEPIDPELEWPDPGSRSLDHIVAMVNGGSHTRHNTQASHLVCNQKKGSRAVTLVSIAT